MTTTRTLACLSLIAFFALIFTGTIRAQAVSSRPAKLTVVYTEWYPYTHQEGGTAKGFEIEIFKAVMDRMGIRTEFFRYPFKRCLKMLHDGNADAVVSILITPERRNYTIFPKEHISMSKTLFFTKAGSAIQYGGSLKDLQKYSIGVIAGFSYGKAFDSAAFLRKEEVPNAERLVNMVLNDRYDLGVENQAVVRGVSRKLGVERSVRFLYPPVHTQKLYVGFSKKLGLQKLSSDFSEALAQFKKTDEFRDILRKYGITYEEMAQ